MKVLKNYHWVMMTAITKQARTKKTKTMTMKMKMRTKTHSMTKIKTVMVAKKMASKFRTARKKKR